ncbi:hypothetical protein SPFM12_00286 [Salmonella phage SPFM12]|nr:hypothetical protein SPFM12_00286 [Salmonella phage SPFM12]
MHITALDAKRKRSITVWGKPRRDLEERGCVDIELHQAGETRGWKGMYRNSGKSTEMITAMGRSGGVRISHDRVYHKQ